MKPQFVVFASLLFASLLAACAADDLSTSATTQSLKDNPGIDEDGGMCPEWGCGSNSPVIEFLAFHELHELGQFNEQGFRIARFEKYYLNAWRNYRPDVMNGTLVARSRYNNEIVWSDEDDIRNMRFVIANADGEEVVVTIVDVGRVYLWAHTPSVARRLVPTYKLVVSGKYAATGVNVCGASAEADGITANHAVLFDDDRIDADALEVVGQTRDWFNIGCKGHALAKLDLLGHTKAASYLLGTTTTLDQRTAVLKSLTADYCGNGNPFTTPGQPLKLRLKNGMYNNIVSDTSQFDIEARWSASGAICLNVPRIDFISGSGDSVPTTFPNGVGGLISEYCELPPPCMGDDTSNYWGADLITANPIVMN